MLKIGLTGGIASGKTTVSDYFSRLGISVIDADQISQQLTAAGTPAVDKIGNQLGSQFILPNGGLDRKRLRETIFNDPSAKTTLENILHPAIRDEMLARLKECTDQAYTILVIPLLVENRLQELTDRVLVVDAPEAIQVERLCQRDQCTTEQARKILAAQASRVQRLNIADDVLLNNGSLPSLLQQVDALHARYLVMAVDNN